VAGRHRGDGADRTKRAVDVHGGVFVIQKRFSSGLLMTVAIVISACSGSGATNAPASSAPAGSSGASAGSGSDLLIWADDKRAAALKPLADKFGQENGVTVTVEAISKDLIKNFKTASNAGTGPDIVVWAHDTIGDLVRNGLIDPIQGADTSGFDPLAVKGMTFDGQLYGIPYSVENIGLFRNTDLVPDAPTTMEDLIAKGEALVKDGKAEHIMSLQVGQKGDAYHIYPLFSSAGGSFFGLTANGDPDPKNITVDSPESIAAGEKIGAIGEKGDKALKTSIDNTNAIQLFFNKKAPFLVSGPWAVADIKKAGLKYDISHIPQWEGAKPAGPFIGVNGFYLATKGKNKTLAQEFAANYLTTKDVQIALYEAEPRRPALTEAVNEVKATDPDIDKFQAAAEGGTILPAIPEMAQVWDPFGVAEASIVKGDDVTKALEGAAKAIRDSIG
jgi:arabinogalactan oligomer/maltooligosaccharide transport system substrate-binding protein